MKIAEEPFIAADAELLNKIYQDHLGQFLAGVFGVLFFATMTTLFPDRRRKQPETPQEYWDQFLFAVLLIGGVGLYTYYRSKWALRKDLKIRLKEIYEFEVLKKERFFAEGTFFIFINENQREQIPEALYLSLQKGDHVRYSQSKYAKERLSELVKCESDANMADQA